MSSFFPLTAFIFRSRSPRLQSSQNIPVSPEKEAQFSNIAFTEAAPPQKRAFTEAGPSVIRTFSEAPARSSSGTREGSNSGARDGSESRSRGGTTGGGSGIVGEFEDDELLAYAEQQIKEEEDEDEEDDPLDAFMANIEVD